MHEEITSETLQQLRNDGNDVLADEIERLMVCSRRLSAIGRWLEDNQPDVFKRGLWDAINAA